MRLITIATFNFASQVYLAKSLLETQGIVCRITNEHSGSSEGVGLQVPEDAVEAALGILDGVEPPAEQEDDSRLVSVGTLLC